MIDLQRQTSESKHAIKYKYLSIPYSAMEPQLFDPFCHLSPICSSSGNRNMFDFIYELQEQQMCHCSKWATSDTEQPLKRILTAYDPAFLNSLILHRVSQQIINHTPKGKITIKLINLSYFRLCVLQKKNCH